MAIDTKLQALIDARLALITNIQNKGVDTLSTDTYQTLANKVNQIITVAPAKEVDILLVGGGGGGSGGSGSSFEGCGGGAGGYIYKTALQLSSGVYNITIGVGGNGGAGGKEGYSGTHSVFDNILFAIGGCGGRKINGTGGSGGGSLKVDTINKGITGQGNDGGTTTGFAFGGAGGGAGSKGGNYSGVNGFPAANGGAGLLCSISGTPRWYAGGGGNANDGIGGSGVGGDGATKGTVGANAIENTGSGGGGGSSFGSKAGGKGANGICIIRYKTSLFTATGGVITTDGEYTVHTFVSDGVFTIL